MIDTIKLFWSYMKHKKYLYYIGISLSIFTILITPIPAKILGYAIDKCILSENKDKNTLIVLLIALILIVGIRLILRYTMLVIIEVSTQEMYLNVRNVLYRNIQKLDQSFYSTMPTGDLMARLTGDVDLIRHFFSWILLNGLEYLLLFIVNVIFLFYINIHLTLILLTVAPFIILINLKMFKVIRPIHLENRNAASFLNRVAQENISGNRTVKAFAREDYEQEKMDKANTNIKGIAIKLNKEWLKYHIPIYVLSNILSGLALVFGAFYVMNGKMSVGDLSVFTGLAWALNLPLIMTATVLNDFQRFSASCEKILPIFYAKPLIKDKENAKHIASFSDKIEFKNVTLDLNGKSVIDDVSFVINKGDSVSIMGPTGSGKTMLISLLLRYYDVTSGSITIDGIDIRDIYLLDLRRIFGVSAQDVFLFSNTIEGNIAYSDVDMPFETIKKYSTLALADEFVLKTSDGYDTIIGERGVGLSGGQKQRLSLARALATKSDILILDDTTSAVDMETEKKIQNSLEKIENSTKIIIAQRVSSVTNSTKIIVMDRGRIAEIGTHEELKSNKGYYERIFDIQSSM